MARVVVSGVWCLWAERSAVLHPRDFGGKHSASAAGVGLAATGLRV